MMDALSRLVDPLRLLDRLVHLARLRPEPLRAVVLAASLATDDGRDGREPRLGREVFRDRRGFVKRP